MFVAALPYRIICTYYEGNIKENQTPGLDDDEYLMDRDNQFGEDHKIDIDVPFFELEFIVAATGNFSQAHIDINLARGIWPCLQGGLLSTISNAVI
ncbi:hypothetical protein DCAR_0624346 [Daucus carota subsp. sativus]|uniref:Uncharacterized protein n=1 Tax=Daucus carota subsp. sativus TaxID=79200 RepID=A0A164VSC4_DAUCS|nr:hypothetical protein DCAR_0624346 [Daucus carota subsp. sativus]